MPIDGLTISGSRDPPGPFWGATIIAGKAQLADGTVLGFSENRVPTDLSGGRLFLLYRIQGSSALHIGGSMRVQDARASVEGWEEGQLLPDEVRGPIDSVKFLRDLKAAARLGCR